MSETTPFWLAVILINFVSITATVLKWLDITPPMWAIVIMVILFIVGVSALVTSAILYLRRHLRWVDG